MMTPPSFPMVIYSDDLTPGAFRAYARLLATIAATHPEPPQLQPGSRAALAGTMPDLERILGRKRSQIYAVLKELAALQLATHKKDGRTFKISLTWPSGFLDPESLGIRKTGLNSSESGKPDSVKSPALNELITTTTLESIYLESSNSTSGKPDGPAATAADPAQLTLLAPEPDPATLAALQAAGVNGNRRTLLATRNDIDPNTVAAYQADLKHRYGARYRPGLLITALEQHQPGDTLPAPPTQLPSWPQDPPGGAVASITAETLLPATLPTFSRLNAALDGQAIRIPVLAADLAAVKSTLASCPAPDGWNYEIRKITP